MLACIRQTVSRSLSSQTRLLTTTPSALANKKPNTHDQFSEANGILETSISDAAGEGGGSPSSVVSHTGPTLATIDPSLISPPPAQDPLLHYLTSRLTTHGHRHRASKITSEILLHIHTFTRAPPLPILREAVLKASPAVRTLMHRQGGKTVAKPVALGEKQRTKYAVKWILDGSEKRKGGKGGVAERVAREMIEIVEGRSEVLGEKEKVHKFAMVNRGNARTRI